MNLVSRHSDHHHVKTLKEARALGGSIELRTSKLPPRIPGYPYEVCIQCGSITLYEGDELMAEAAGHYDQLYTSWNETQLSRAGLLERALERCKAILARRNNRGNGKEL